MRPLTVLIGIVLGSCVAITLGLAVVSVIYLVLGPEEPVLRRELLPLGMSLLIFSLLTALAALSFYGSLMARHWRHLPGLALLSGLALTVYYYWP